MRILWILWIRLYTESQCICSIQKGPMFSWLENLDSRAKLWMRNDRKTSENRRSYNPSNVDNHLINNHGSLWWRIMHQASEPNNTLWNRCWDGVLQTKTHISNWCNQGNTQYTFLSKQWIDKWKHQNLKKKKEFLVLAMRKQTRIILILNDIIESAI